LATRVDRVYLICFDTPFYYQRSSGAWVEVRHYVGQTGWIYERMAHHKNGTGAVIVGEATARGVRWEVTRLWKGDRGLERAIKRQHNARSYCPRCAARERRASARGLARFGAPRDEWRKLKRTVTRLNRAVAAYEAVTLERWKEIRKRPPPEPSAPAEGRPSAPEARPLIAPMMRVQSEARDEIPF